MLLAAAITVGVLLWLAVGWVLTVASVVADPRTSYDKMNQILLLWPFLLVYDLSRIARDRLTSLAWRTAWRYSRWRRNRG